MQINPTIYNVLHCNGFFLDVFYGCGRLRHILKEVQNRAIELFARRDWATVKILNPKGCLNIGVTNICNADCCFCAKGKVKLNTGVMVDALYKRVVDEWIAMGGKTISQSPSIGEPLIDPEIVEKVRYAKKAGVEHVAITTNGILLNRNGTFRHLIDAGLDEINISAEGVEREAYARTFGVDKFDDMWTGLTQLLRYNAVAGEPCAVWINFRNSAKPSQIVRSERFKTDIRPYLSTQVRIRFTAAFDDWAGNVTRAHLHGIMKMKPKPSQVKVPCQNLFTPAVMRNGNIRLCSCRLKVTDEDDLVVGNVRTDRLTDLNSNPKARAIVAGFLKGQRPTACEGCGNYIPAIKKPA